MASKYKEIEYIDFKGIDTQNPSSLLPPGVLAGGRGFLIRDRFLLSQPAIKATYSQNGQTLPAPFDITNVPFPIHLCTSFIDANNVSHTIVATVNKGSGTETYQLKAGWTTGSAWATQYSFTGTPYGSAIAGPYPHIVFLNKLYFSDGFNLYYLTGLVGDSVTIATQVNSQAIGGTYLGILADSMLMLYTIENGTFFSARVRWSVPGNPTVFDPGINPAAGFNDLLEIEDAISGFCRLGTYGYIMTPHNIVVMSPTGTATNPFDFDDLWYAPYGVGCAFPQTLDAFAGSAFFVCIDNVYQLTLNGVDPIGEPILDTLFACITNTGAFAIPTTGGLNTFVYAKILPAFNNTTMRPNLMYNIYVGRFSTGHTATYIFSYNMQEKTWSIFFTDKCVPTLAGDIITVG